MKWKIDYVAKDGIITFGSHFTNPRKDYERSAASGNQDRGYLGGEYNLNDDGKSYERLMTHGKITNMSEWGISDSLESDNPQYQERVFNAMNLLEDVILRMVEEDGYKMASDDMDGKRNYRSAYVR